MELIMITDRIKLIPGLNNGLFPHSHSLLIDDEVRTIIDSGAGEKQLQEINPATISQVINSHCHYDHVAGNRLFPQAQILVHKLDAPVMGSVEQIAILLGCQIWPELMGQPCWKKITVKSGESWVTFGEKASYRYRTSPVHRVFNDRHLFKVGEVEFTAIHTPGHTPGHCVFHFPKERVVFSADIDATDWGPFYGNVVSNLEQMIESIQKVIALKPEVLLTGHSRPVTANVEARLIKYLDKIYEREDKILKFLRQPRIMDEISAQKIIYREHWDDKFVFWEKIMVHHHLMHLIKTRQVVRRGETFVQADYA